MSFQKSTSALKEEVLTIVGELTNGTSDFESITVQYLNDVYQGLLSGGNEFGFDVGEPWMWAQSKRPILLALQPAQIGSATVTNGSVSGTFGLAPTTSMVGRFFKIDTQTDLYRIVEHTASSTSFQLDQPFLMSSGSYNYTAYKLDYEAVDDIIVIDSSNNKIDFTENGGGTLTATITAGAYSPTSLAAAIETALESTGTQSYTVSFNSLTRKFTLLQGGSAFTLLFGNGPNVETSISEAIGFDLLNQTGALTYTSAYANSGIMRLTKPITMYREAPSYYASARDVGKAFLIDDNTFLREYPLNRLRQDIPDKFCLSEQNPTGLWKLRFNASVLDNPVRAEVNYIPVTRKLVNSVYSIPKVPGSYSKYLVYGAAYFLLLDRSDNKADLYLQLAKAKLQALINDNRKGLTLGGNGFGRLIPRQGQIKPWGWFGGNY